MTDCDLLIVGAGAAGLAAAIFAGEAARGTQLRILLVDGAQKPGAKILVSGGGRCNVTNDIVTPDDFSGGPRPIVRNVLRAFDEKRTLAWMTDLGVTLKLEPTGKYFPTSDSARTVLDALFRRVRELCIDVQPATRITRIHPLDGAFEVTVQDREPIHARAVIVATGGLSLPKSGSDGHGLRLLTEMGHALVPTTPALVPLLLGSCDGPAAGFADWSGLTIEATLALRDPNGKALATRDGSLLFTHFGLSGPAALDLSRHLLRARLDHPGDVYTVSLGHPQFTRADQADAWLRAQAAENPKRLAANTLAGILPERLARAIAANLGPMAQITREQRTALARLLTAMPLNVTGDRGYTFAETTAGGIDLREIDHATMRSRRVKGLFLCGELLDVDGRIGGFNFQWAWASGYLAGRAAVASLRAE